MNISKGNMYEFITHTWNTIKGKCYHDCSYCYMKRFKQNSVRFDDKELKTDLGNVNFIFVGSSCDMFAQDIPAKWIAKTLNYCACYDTRYLFQTKNPFRFLDYIDACIISDKSVLCTTIETNRTYLEIMGNSPLPEKRAEAMEIVSEVIETFITIEPILDFDLNEMVELIRRCKPEQVNIGTDSGNNHLPEPTKEKLLELINELKKFTVIHKKSNLSRFGI